MWHWYFVEMYLLNGFIWNKKAFRKFINDILKKHYYNAWVIFTNLINFLSDHPHFLLIILQCDARIRDLCYMYLEWTSENSVWPAPPSWSDLDSNINSESEWMSKSRIKITGTRSSNIKYTFNNHFKKLYFEINIQLIQKITKLENNEV